MGRAAALVGVIGLSGCSVFSSKEAKETGRTTAQVETDKAITGRVQGELKDAPVYKFPSVRAQTFNNVVQLSGFVATEDQKRTAGQIRPEHPGSSRGHQQYHASAGKPNTHGTDERV